MEQVINFKYVLNSLLYAGVGLVVLTIAFKIFDKATPSWNISREIIEEHNVALAIIVGAVALAIAQIIAASIHG